MSLYKTLLIFFTKQSTPINLEFKIGGLKFIHNGTLKVEKENQFLFVSDSKDKFISFNLSNIIDIDKERPYIKIKV